MSINFSRMNTDFFKIKLLLFFILFPFINYGQSITHPASGSSSSTITCGTTYTYYDPGGTGDYGNNQLGTLVLNPSDPGKYVSINFGAGPFNVETHATCGYDWIKIYDGPTIGSPLIGTYCNSNVPGTITSSSGSLTVVFDSDGSTVASGWVANVTCSSTQGTPLPITQPTSGTSSTYIGCGATYTYYDPGGTSNYGNSLSSTYTLFPNSVGQMIQIDFTVGAFSIEPNGGGCYDYIRIYDGPTTGSPLLGTYCSSNVPTVVSSTTGPLTVVFYSDGLTTASGWVATVSCFTPCGVVAGTSSSSVTASCGLTSTTLSLAGEDAGASIQWQQSTNGGVTWTNIVGATTDPYVHSVSVTTMFRAQVTNGCTSTSTTSTITINCIITQPTSGSTSTTIQCGAGTYTYYDSGGTSNYGNGQSSTLTINPSAVGQMVQINFGAGAFSVEPNGAGCYDYIRIYNGPTTGSPLLGTYCSSNVPGIITSTTGPLTIVFYSDGSTTASGWVANVTCFSPCAVVGGTSTSSVTNSCPTVTTTLSLSGQGAGSIQWQQSTNGGVTWTNIAGATTNPYNYTASVYTLFRAAVTSGCTSYSSISSINFACPDIIHPASGISSSTIQCGGSYIYRDPGNTSNYSNNQNGLITLCPSVAGQYVNVNFSSFSTETSYDYFYVFDGNNASAPLLGVYSGTALTGSVKATSSNTSGCLSFRFFSDGGTTASGWQATVTCSSTPSAVVPTTSPRDCQGAITVCSNSALVGGSTGGGFHELPDPWNSCIDQKEFQSTWYVFSSTTNGTIGFQITPNSPTDYDWAIWGPYNSLQCPAFNNDVPVRCSSTQLIANGNTGLVAPAIDVIEQNGEYGGGANENGFLRPLDVLAGEVYVMMLDNWSASTVGFQLNWTLTNGANLDCTPPLPVNMSNYNTRCEQGKTKLEWSTLTEINNDYFSIEKSDEKFNFIEIGRVLGSGNSNINQNYSFTDPILNDKTTYYRVKQVDYNGEQTYYRVLASNCLKKEFEVIKTQLNSNSLDLIINSFEQEDIIVYLYDIHGKLIVQENKMLGLGNNKLSVSQFNISSGVYLINIVGEIHHYQSKLIKR